MMRETVRDRRIMVREIGQDAVDECAVLFVAKSAANKAKPVLEALNGRPILTIGDHDGFISAGGAINLYLVNGKVRFDAPPGYCKSGGADNELAASEACEDQALDRDPDE
jgi:hypothetical protein